MAAVAGRERDRMYGEWMKWEPLPGLDGHYIIDSIVDSTGGLEIMLSSSRYENKVVRVLFDGVVYAYRSAEESFILGTLAFLDDHYEKGFYPNWSFFKVKGSGHFQAACRGMDDVFARGNFEQFSFFTSDVLFDVISDREPKFKYFVAGEKP